MHNQNFFRSFENGNDDDRILNDGIVSIIGDDYLLNFLNESEPNPKTNKQPNLFSQMFQEGPAAFPGFQDQPRPSDSFANMYSKMSMHDPWMLSNMVEPQKNPTQIGLGYKIENPDDLEGSSKSKKIKTEKETSLNVKRPSEVSNKNKNNTKNTYINKINTLISEESEIEVKPEVPKILEAMKPESKKSMVIKDETEPQISVIPKPSGMKKVRSYDVLKSDECDKLNVKLARNRESARKSRKRKKVYIELLEKKVDQLQQELDETKKQLEQNSSSLSKANVQNKILGGLHSAEQTLIEKLESMIGTKSDETEISFLIDSLRLRLGTTGKERISAVNYFYKQLLEYLVPVHMKYLLWASVEGKDLFSNRDANLLNSIPPNIIGKGDFQNESTDYWQEIASQLNMTENQKKNVLKYKKKLTVEKQKLETIVNNMNQARKDLLKQTKSVQDVVDDFSSIFSPAQFGKLLINLDKEKNRKEFRADKLWIAPAMKKENGGDLSDDSDDFLEESDMGPSSMEQERNNESMRLSEAAYDFEPIRQTKRNNSKKMS